MFQSPTYQQPQMEFVCIEQLVRPDHLLRKIDRHIAKELWDKYMPPEGDIFEEKHVNEFSNVRLDVVRANFLHPRGIELFHGND